MDLLCALTSDNALFGESDSDVAATMAAQRSGKVAAKRVNIDAALGKCYDITPYSEIYGFLPSTMVATHNGWKPVSACACHFSGKTSAVIKTRLATLSSKRDHDAIYMFRRTRIRTAMAIANGENTLLKTHQVSASIDDVANAHT